jgi:hypothetical protein
LQCPTSVLITPFAIPENVWIVSVSNALKTVDQWGSGSTKGHPRISSEEQICFVIILSRSLFFCIAIIATHFTQKQNKIPHITVWFFVFIR